MTIYPAIDIKGGRAVRLVQGHMNQSTDYGDPGAAAKRWQDIGAQYIHVVDLDGAIEGSGANLDTVSQIVNSVSVPVQLGGGIRTLEDIQIRLDEIGVTRVILGTIATSDPDLVRDACRRWPGRIVLGLDVRDGVVAVRGWVEKSNATPDQIMALMKDAGVDTIIFTDIRRDGMMQGPNIEATRKVVKDSGLSVIGSGGVSSLDNVRALKEAGCEGVIIGTALYSGAIQLADALRI